MFAKHLVFTAALALCSQGALAAGGNDDDAVPKPTQTTKECKNGKIWSEKKNRCVKPGNAALDDDTRYGAVREYAYAGQYENAQTVLRAMSNQNDDRVMTYWGFTHRKMGDIALGMSFYEQAIAMNPDNILARSYMGQAHVEADETYLAWLQLQEIRTRGGEGTWAEKSLTEAIQTGVTYNY